MSRLRDLLIKRRSEVTPLPEVYYDVEKQGTLNEHTTKDKLIDFSGNGNHGTLHNFTFDETNGWGYYADTNYKLEVNNEQSEKLSKHKYRLNCPATKTSGCICLLGQKIEGAFTNLKLPKIKVKVTTDSETTVGSLGLYIDEVRNFDYYYLIGNGENIIEFAPITCTESFQLLVTHDGNDTPYNIEFLPTDEDCLRFNADARTYVSLDTLAKGFKTIFMVFNPAKLGQTIYDQRARKAYNVGINRFSIYGENKAVAWNERNTGGVTYINGELNNTKLPSSLIGQKHCATLVNEAIEDGDTTTPSIGKGIIFSDNSFHADMKLYKFLGFKEALSPEQIQRVIDRYNLYTE